MYNRYIRTDTGAYRRIPTPEPPPEPQAPPPAGEEKHAAGRLLDKILERLDWRKLDGGDLLLLLLLFFLFEEKADDEALIALGLLLIL